MNGTYDVHVLLAGDGKVFCALSDGENTYTPEDIERIEAEMGAVEERYFGREVLEERLTPEPDRTEEAPVIGTVTYRDGERVVTSFDMSAV